MAIIRIDAFAEEISSEASSPDGEDKTQAASPKFRDMKIGRWLQKFGDMTQFFGIGIVSPKFHKHPN